jgi:hypothetical protein
MALWYFLSLLKTIISSRMLIGSNDVDCPNYTSKFSIY